MNNKKHGRELCNVYMRVRAGARRRETPARERRRTLFRNGKQEKRGAAAFAAPLSVRFLSN